VARRQRGHLAGLDGLRRLRRFARRADRADGCRGRVGGVEPGAAGHDGAVRSRAAPRARTGVVAGFEVRRGPPGTGGTIRSGSAAVELATAFKPNPAGVLLAPLEHARRRGSVFRQPDLPATATELHLPARSGHFGAARSEVNRSLTFGWQFLDSEGPCDRGNLGTAVASAVGRTPRVAWTMEHVRGRWLTEG
jgi:hypothetical protein